ncbi:MAG TPA: hypothetical protein VN736_29410 [Candidatus Limnocylindrales bacterium]|nr:hypothetical protein [Candidatus Limnocylindrales bacterium]
MLKRLITLVGIIHLIALAAGIINVRVSTSTQQAIITYGAPDSNVCSISVTDPSGNLMPDVNPAYFTGSNVDSRSGSYTLGNTRILVLGQRGTFMGVDGNYHSRSYVADTTYSYVLACGPGGSVTTSGTFKTLTIQQGLGAGDPIPSAGGAYTYPHVDISSAAHRNDYIAEPHTGAYVKNFATSNDMSGDPISVMLTFSGMGQMCSPATVTASNGDTGHHCELGLKPSVSSGGFTPGMYWISSTTGEVRFLGPMSAGFNGNTPGWAAGSGCNNSSGLLTLLDNLNGSSFYCQLSATDGSGTIVVKVTYTGHQTLGQDVDLTGQTITTSGTPHSIINTPYVIPFGRTLETLIKEFDPTITELGSILGGGGTPVATIHGDFLYQKFYWYATANQNVWAQAGVFDMLMSPATHLAKFGNTDGCIDNQHPATGMNTGSTYAGYLGCIEAAMDTLHSIQGSPFRFGGIHSYSPSIGLDDNIAVVSLHSMAEEKASESYYAVTTSSGLAASGTPCTMLQPAGTSNITDWPDLTWGPGCSTMIVTGEPAYVQVGDYLYTWPATVTAAPGDLLTTNGGSLSVEMPRLLYKGADGKTWYIQRQYHGVGWSGHTGPNVYTAVAPNGTIQMAPPMDGNSIYWDWRAGPHGTNAYRENLDQVHTSWLSNPTFGYLTTQAFLTQVGNVPARLSANTVLTQGRPSFNGLITPSSSDAVNSVESHPALPVMAPINRTYWAQTADGHPYTGTSYHATSTTLVSGQLYRLRGFPVGSEVTVPITQAYKRIPFVAVSGSRVFTEMSGPSAAMTTDSSTQYRFCIALVNGECFSGSLAGDVYANAPGVTALSCSSQWSAVVNFTTLTNDLCVFPLSAWVQGSTLQQAISDPAGVTTRILTNSLDAYLTTRGFWNSRTTPNGSWFFTDLSMDKSVKLIKVPSLPVPDGIDRTHYIPFKVSLPGGAGRTAIVKFGYDEYGSPSSFYCTARQESCYVTAATINTTTPFSYAYESLAPAPCDNGCIITIPAIPGRLLRYQVQYGGSPTASKVYVALVP